MVDQLGTFSSFRSTVAGNLFAYLLSVKRKCSLLPNPIIVFCECRLNLSSFDFVERDLYTGLGTGDCYQVLVVGTIIH